VSVLPRSHGAIGRWGQRDWTPDAPSPCAGGSTPQPATTRRAGEKHGATRHEHDPPFGGGSNADPSIETQGTPEQSAGAFSFLCCPQTPPKGRKMARELTSDQQVRLASINVASEYADDIESLFNLASAVEFFINTGELPDIREEDEETASKLN
jgi:hypothetical protein